MSITQRLSLIKEVGEEIITEDELKFMLKKKKSFVAYDGFEPSGKDIHIAQGLLRAININKMVKAGAKFKILVADWHAWANNKMGGDLEKIQKVGKYLIEVWKACDMKLDNVEFIWASSLLNSREYWKTVMQVARNSTIKRIIRCGQIMGRAESEVLHSSQIFYPCMQCADIFHLKADICQLGMDQRKVSILARELGERLGFWKPVIVSHHMLMGLEQPDTEAKTAVERAIAMKMSKSKPDSAIFMTDSKEDIFRKVKKAYCPEKQIEENPIIEYCRYILFERFKKLKVRRDLRFGGDFILDSYKMLVNAYKKGELHPLDLKNSVAEYLNRLIEPVRLRILKNPKTRALFEEIKGFEVTR